MFRGFYWLVIPILFGCSSIQVSSDYDADADFAALHSYDWLVTPDIKSGESGVQHGNLTGARVKKLVEEQFARKGYVRGAGQPDFLVSYHVVIEDKVSVTYINELYGYGPAWGNPYRRNIRHYGSPGDVAMVNEYQQGTLLLDIVKGNDRRLIWRGIAMGEVYPGLDQAAREKRLREAVQKILAQFPPPKK